MYCSLWVAPPEHQFKVNFDAAMTPGSEAIEINVVIRGAHCEFFVVLSKFSKGGCSVETAKLKVGLKTLRFATDTGFRDINLKGDNVSVVNAFKANEDGFA